MGGIIKGEGRVIDQRNVERQDGMKIKHKLKRDEKCEWQKKLRKGG